MKIQYLDDNIPYDGSQLAPLFNYLTHGILGDSIVVWQGACSVPFEHMIDGEDLREQSTIAADKMLHFVLEMFHFPLHGAVALQRLMGERLIVEIETIANNKEVKLERKGDDVYWGSKKLNISIATSSNQSTLIHFAINVDNQGTPVETCALNDFGIKDIKDIKDFALSLAEAFQREYLSIQRATMKVRSF